MLSRLKVYYWIRLSISQAITRIVEKSAGNQRSRKITRAKRKIFTPKCVISTHE